MNTGVRFAPRIILAALAGVVFTLFLVPHAAHADTMQCVLSLNPQQSATIEKSQWDPNMCYNDGPNGEKSTAASQSASGGGGGGQSAIDSILKSLSGSNGSGDKSGANVFKEADDMCHPVKQECGCGEVMGPFGCRGGSNKFLCECHEVVKGFLISGKCLAEGQCKAETAQSMDKKSNVLDSGLSSLSQQLGQLLGQLFGGGGGGASGGVSGGVSSQCPNGYYTTSQPSSDPCAQYVPPTSSQIDLGTSNAQSLLDALGGSSAGADLASQLLGSSGSTGASDNTSGSGTGSQASSGTNGTSNTGTSQQSSGTSGISAVVTQQPTSSVVIPVQSGQSGDITAQGSGATAVANSTDAGSNTSVAGFYGANGASQGVIAGMCQSRPWASNFLSVIIPASFFDNLCNWRGYQVGVQQQTQPTLQQTAPAPQESASTQPEMTGTPGAHIWASPAAVPLDTRTTIFWTAENVTACVESSSDGNFSHGSLSGGAETVPLAGATTFTIQCTAADGSTVTDATVVHLAI